MEPEIYYQLTDSLKSVIDSSSRIDERVKMILEKQTENDRRLMVMMDHLNNLSARVTVIESKDNTKTDLLVEEHRKQILLLEKQVELLNVHRSTANETWKTWSATLLQVLTTLAMGYILYKLGLPSP